jgi:error-prone DNA polymerase
MVPAWNFRISGGLYIELQVTSHFSFLRGASSCEELFAYAALLRIEALAIVDRNSLAGVVRAREAAKTTGVRLIIGCRLERADGLSVLVYPMDRPAYTALLAVVTGQETRQQTSPWRVP